MHFSRITFGGFLYFFMSTQVSISQESTGFKSVPFNNLEAFREPGKNWIIAGDAVADYTKPHDIRPVKGEGALVNNFSKNNQMHLFTKEEFGDLEVELDFMMAKNSNSGIYFQGRYEIQLLDSWMRLNPGSSDIGGIYMRWTPEKGTFEGTAPFMNVARAPGLWQHLSIRFIAPRFNDKGEKIKNARFDQVSLNGVVIQQNAEVTGPTGSGMFRDEKPEGPLTIQGDHGPVALKNIRYRRIGPDDTVAVKKTEWWERVSPIIVKPNGKISFIKSFLNYGNKKLTHVISVGHPDQLNYSYDLKQGALFQVWRGEFIDVTRAWRERGEHQLGVPIGSVIVLSDAPAIAVLNSESSAWPDSIAFDDMHNKGYMLDKQRSPTFSYSFNGLEVKDSVVFNTDREGITRTISVINPPANVYCRMGSGRKIENIGNDIYAIDDKTYYIKVDKKFKPAVRQSGKGFELIARYETAGPITYSIIW